MNWGRNPEDLVRRVPKSIEGLGTADSSQVEHSPVLLTAANVNLILAEVGRTAPISVLGALGVVATSAVEAHNRYEEKNFEAVQEELAQRARWEKFTAAPLEAELQAIEVENRGLIGIESRYRAEAAAIAASNGLRFELADLGSLDAFRNAIESNFQDAEEIRGNSQTAHLKAKVPMWLNGVCAISPICLCILTALGLSKLLFDVDLQTAAHSPMFVLACALALGVTVPVLVWGYRFGWIFATARENLHTAIPSARSTMGMLLGMALLLVVTACLAGIDMMAIRALTAETIKGNSRLGLPTDIPWWMPWLGFAFTFSAVATNVWSGYCDSIQEYQDDQVFATQRSQVERVRASVSDAIKHIVTADLAAARLAELQPRRQELATQVQELTFTAEFSEELILESAVERNAWIGESGRFWAMVWMTIHDPTLRNTTRRYIRPQSRPTWKTLFGWLRR